MKKSLNVLLAFGALLVWASCDKNRVFEDNQAIENNIWAASKPVQFEVEFSDTLSPLNFYFNLRHADAYPFSNLFVFLTTTFPNGKSARDTMEFVLQGPDGKWLGSGLGDIWDNQIPFRKGLRVPLKGKYRFSFEQAMRSPELPMVMEVGMRIEKDQPAE